MSTDNTDDISSSSCRIHLPGKKGAAFCLRDEGQKGCWIENLPKVESLRAHWNYSWSCKRISAQPEHIEFVPMTWGGHNVQTLRKHLDECVRPEIKAGRVKMLMGFNEPDHRDQSNMSVSKALELWPELEAMGVPLVSPSAAHPGRAWMEDFMAASPRVDCIGVHWYAGPNATAFQQKLREWHEQFGGRPLIITEFAVADWQAKHVEDNRYSAARVLEFMKEVLPWLEETSWIVGYAWFSFCETSPPGTCSALFDTEGALTTLGRYYASIRTETPNEDVR